MGACINKYGQKLYQNMLKNGKMFTSAIKKQPSVCCSILLNPYMAFQTWNHGKKKPKEINSIALYC